MQNCKKHKMRYSLLAWLSGIFLFAIAGFRLGDLVRQKWDYSSNNAAQLIVQGYYEEPEQSLDVLFCGASTVRNGMSPVQMFKEYGFTGYSRATSIQAPVISYNLLLETLENHKLKAVVIDATTLSQVTNNANDMEGKYHEAIDFMPMSKYKWNIISEITANGEYSIADFVLPLYRYHDRWDKLEEQDFTYHSWRKDYPYKGQYPILKISGYAFPDDYMIPGVMQDTNFQLDNDAIYYFDKIVDLCNAKNIKLILVKTPVGSWDWQKHDTVAKYAELSGVEFIDFNIPELQKEIGFDATYDFCDDGRHPNLTGAKKMRSYIGAYLVEVCDFEDKRGVAGYEAWDESCKLYNRLLYDRTIITEANLIKYFDMINRRGYTIIIAAQNDTSKYFSDEVKNAFAGLGLNIDVSDTSYQSYVAVISEQQVYFEQQAVGSMVSFCDNVSELDLVISSFADKSIGNSTSIRIDGTEYSLQGSGFNVVVYDNIVGQVVARRTFDTGRSGNLYTLMEN